MINKCCVLLGEKFELFDWGSRRLWKQTFHFTTFIIDCMNLYLKFGESSAGPCDFQFFVHFEENYWMWEKLVLSSLYNVVHKNFKQRIF